MPPPAVTNEETGDHLEKTAVPPRWLLFPAGILPLIFGWNTSLLTLKIPNFERTYSEMLGDKPLPAITRMRINAGRLADGAAFPGAILTLTGFAPAFLLVRRDEPIGWKVSLGGADSASCDIRDHFDRLVSADELDHRRTTKSLIAPNRWQPSSRAPD